MERSGFVSLGVRRIRKGGGEPSRGNLVVGPPIQWTRLHDLEPSDSITFYMGIDGSLIIMPGEIHDVTYADSHEELVRRHYASYQNKAESEGE
jgi:hypothetical protein